MKIEGLVLDNTSTTGKVQCLVVKFPIALVSVQLSLQRTPKSQKHEKPLKKPKTTQKTTNHFSGLEHDTVVGLYLQTPKTTKDLKKKEKHNKPEKIEPTQKSQ